MGYQYFLVEFESSKFFIIVILLVDGYLSKRQLILYYLEDDDTHVPEVLCCPDHSYFRWVVRILIKPGPLIPT